MLKQNPWLTDFSLTKPLSLLKRNIYLSKWQEDDNKIQNEKKYSHLNGFFLDFERYTTWFCLPQKIRDTIRICN